MIGATIYILNSSPVTTLVIRIAGFPPNKWTDILAGSELPSLTSLTLRTSDPFDLRAVYHFLSRHPLITALALENETYSSAKPWRMPSLPHLTSLAAPAARLIDFLNPKTHFPTLRAVTVSTVDEIYSPPSQLYPRILKQCLASVVHAHSGISQLSLTIYPEMDPWMRSYSKGATKSRTIKALAVTDLQLSIPPNLDDAGLSELTECLPQWISLFSHLQTLTFTTFDFEYDKKSVQEKRRFIQAISSASPRLKNIQLNFELYDLPLQFSRG
jgi:hypothetical protein